MPVRLWIAGSEDTHLAYTFDVSNHGVKFGGCRGEFKVGDKIEVLYRHKHTQCRVAWITAPEGSSDKQIGAECLEPRKQVWVWSSPRKRMSTKKKIDGPYSETPRLLEKPKQLTQEGRSLLGPARRCLRFEIKNAATCKSTLESPFNLAYPQSSATSPLDERLGTRTPSETWRDCIVELHEDDESDAQICIRSFTLRRQHRGRQ